MNVPLLDLRAQHAPLNAEISVAVNRLLDNTQFILGAEVAALEDEIAGYCGSKFAIGCASGSDALLLALMAYETGAGDEVITTPFSFFSTVSSITRLGARAVFVDIEPETFNLDVRQIEEKITARTKAIMPVHLFGQCAEMDALLEISEKHNVPIVEDAAQAIGAEETGGRRAGAIGEIGCFSFYPSKNLGGAGDGGMLTTDDDELTKKLKILRVHGSEVKYFHTLVGLNSRLDALQAAVLRVKLPHLDTWSNARKQNADRYRQLFADAGLTEQIALPFERENVRHIYNQFTIRVPQKRDRLKNFLSENGVGTDIYYPVPLHLQDCFEFLNYKAGDLPASEAAAREVLALPIYPELTGEQQEYVVNTIAKFFQNND